MASIRSTYTPQILAATISSLGRFIPEPKSSSGISFGGVMRSLGSVIGGTGANLSGIDAGYQDILLEQMRVQEQMQLVSMASNIEKSKHETNMAIVRNARVG